MMIRSPLLALAILFHTAGGWSLAAQDSAAAKAASGGVPEKDSKEKEGSPPTFFLRDRSKITGFPKMEVLEVRTQYGALSIPRDQIVRIRFSRRLSPELKDRIQKLIADLGDEDFDRREAATKALGEIGLAALDALRKAAKSTNEEVKNRAGILVSGLDQQLAESRAGAEDSLQHIGGSDDEIVTSRMTIKGLIPHPEFAIQSRYGELRVATADLTGIVFRSAGPQAMKLDVAPTYQPPGNWMDTKFDLENGQKLKIEATGQIHVRNYGVSSGPDGNRDWGGTSFQNFPMLSLVGKIGKRGQAFLIGNGYTGRVRTAGRLYVAIVTFSPNPGGANGAYKVSIQASGGD